MMTKTMQPAVALSHKAKRARVDDSEQGTGCAVLARAIPGHAQQHQAVTEWFASMSADQRSTLYTDLIKVSVGKQEKLHELTGVVRAADPHTRVDFITLLPRTCTQRILMFMDHRVLLRASTVSKKWCEAVNDEEVWKHLCMQHINKKCESCGLSLPLLSAMPRGTGSTWKQVFRDRFVVEQNWRDGRCVQNILQGHTSAVTCIVFAQSRIVTGSTDCTMRVWSTRTMKCSSVLVGHKAAVLCVKFDSARIISGSADGEIKIWDHQGHCVRTLCGEASGILCLDYTNEILVAGTWIGRLDVWKFTDGSTCCLEGHTSRVNDLVIKEDRAISASDDRTLRIWSLVKMQELVRIDGHMGSVSSVCPLKQCIASGGDDNIVRLWEINDKVDGYKSSREYFGHVGKIVCLEMDLFRIVSASKDGTMKIWNKDTGAVLYSSDTSSSNTSCSSSILCVAMDDRAVVTGCENGAVIFYNFADLALLSTYR